MDNKVCTKCGINKNIIEYNIHKQTNTGYATWCKTCTNQYLKLYREKNKERLKIKAETYRKNNPEKMKTYYQRNYEKHRETIIKRKVTSNNKRRKVRKQNDPAYKMQCNLRRRMLLAVNGKRKMSSTFDLIGCTPEFLKDYLESKFSTGMNWDNYGYEGWHIDHILPCSSFDLTDPEQQKKCFHYTNLQPLWAKDNMSKGDNISFK